MIPTRPADPRLSLQVDPRVGRLLVKAATSPRRRLLRQPSSVQTEAERPFWGKHYDADLSAIEEEFFAWGNKFLLGLLSVALGRNIGPRTIVKAGWISESARVSGWGRVLDLFNADKPAADLMDGWSKVIEKVTAAMAPAGDQAAAAQALALRTHLMHSVGERVALPPTLPSWQTALASMTPSQVESCEWTKARAAEHVQHLTDSARHALATCLIDSKMADEGPKRLEQRLFEQFAGLNRDWRRVALTETAMATQNGLLSSVDPDEGWEAVWHAAPHACPFCLSQHRAVFRVVSPNDPNRNGDTDVWAGKSNVGRSAHKYSKKEGRFRDKHELWWVCIPAHPHCACLWTLRRIKKKA